MNMMKKIVNIVFAVVGLAMISLPLFGMAVAPTTTTTENRRLAEFPSLQEDGHFNVDYLSELGTYFTDHFMGKNELVAADSQVQSRVFKVSSVDTILVGENDWLYYTDSLEDYLGEGVVTPRGAYNIAHNIALMQEKVEAQGSDFLFTVAPNKNSLYDENMPSQYQVKASEISNIDLVAEQLKLQQVPYADLFQVFRSQDEVLYCTQDSHWNLKGAVLAYETLREAQGKKVIDFNQKADVVHTKLEPGDLAKALYSINAEVEWNYRYDYDSSVVMEGDAASWEDTWIETTNADGKKKLLMFRDSFGITLAPFVAEDYAAAAFSRDTVYSLDTYMEQVKPDNVIVEIVERNLDRFCLFDPDHPGSSGPAVMSGVKSDLDIGGAAMADEAVRNQTTVRCEECYQLPIYRLITGTVDESLLDVDTNIYIEVTDGEQTSLYEAFTVSRRGEEAGSYHDNGYLLYLDTTKVNSDEVHVKILTENHGQFQVVGESDCLMAEEEIYE